MTNNRTILYFLILLSTIAAGCGSYSEKVIEGTAGNQTVSAAALDPTIATLQTDIENSPNDVKLRTMLASAYIRKARETGDFSTNRLAREAVDTALELSPEDWDARRLDLSLMATFHKFGDAIQAGKAMLKEMPSDPMVYGILTDSFIETGDYVSAVDSAQKMVDLKPNASSYARVAQLRSLHGDHDGAIEMMITVVKATDPADKEAQSWGLVQLGKEYFKIGNIDRADKTFDEALVITPNYALALVEKARTLSALGHLDEAFDAVADKPGVIYPPTAYQLRGDIEARRGRSDFAEADYRKAEATALEVDGDMHPFALWWSDRGVRLNEALEIATKDFGDNKDIYGADILAWCLYKNGQFLEAKRASALAMRLKTGDARIIYHAGMIEKALGNRKEAKRLLALAVKANPRFDLTQSEIAAAELRSLS